MTYTVPQPPAEGQYSYRKAIIMNYRGYAIMPAFDMSDGKISDNYFVVLRPNGSFARVFDDKTSAKEYIDEELRTIEESFGKEIFKKYLKLISIKLLKKAA